MMEVFSLEDDDCSQMFITQSSPKRQRISNEEVGNFSILGDEMDFSSPCVSVLSGTNNPHYSDISDDDFTEIQCS